MEHLLSPTIENILDEWIWQVHSTEETRAVLTQNEFVDSDEREVLREGPKLRRRTNPTLPCEVKAVGIR